MDKDRYGGFGRVPIMDTVECRPILVVDDDLDACEALSEFLLSSTVTLWLAQRMDKLRLPRSERDRYRQR